MARKNVVVIKSMNAYDHATAPFGPKDIVAVINDARDIGVQLYASQPGSMYFTLPLDHPAVPVINPLFQHYFIQKWDGSAYVTIQGGIITDYDASDNEVVISGVDYVTAMNKYYTPLPGPKLGQKAIPDTDETDLSAGLVSSTKYSSYSGGSIYGRDFGDKERNFPNSYANIQVTTDNYSNTAGLQIDPNPTIYTTSNLPVITPKKIIEHAVKMDKETHYWGTQSASLDSVDSANGDIRIWSGAPQSGTTPAGKENELFVDYVTDVNGNKTGDIKVSGSLFLFRGPSSSTRESYQWVDTDTSAYCSMAVNVKNVGIIFYVSPGGPLYVLQEGYSSSGSTDIGDTSEPLTFSVTFRPVSKYDAATENGYGFHRTVSILTEGVSYSFGARPFYIATLATPLTTAYGSYNQYIYGDITKYSSTNTTSGLKTNSVNNIISSTFTDIMDRSRDYPNLELTVATGVKVSGVTTYTFTTGVPAMLSVGNTVTVSGFSSSNLNGTVTISTISSDRKTVTASGLSGSQTIITTGGKMVKTYTPLKPIVKFTSLNQINTASSVSKHPYATAGQGPIDFWNEVAEIEMGSRVDGSKVVFNFYGVPGATPTGDQLIVNHGVSAASQATLIYPGQIRGFNVINKRSSKVNSVRMVPTTDFLIGVSTEGASGGVKSQGVVRMPDYLVSDPSLPAVVTQGGFISPESAANAGQGNVNDFGTNDDVTNIKVELRTEVFGPIGMTGTPKLGETVTVVVRRKSVGVGLDEIVQTYNVGGMEWMAKIDGSENLYLDLVKPNKFIGPAISWEAKPAPGAEKSSFVSNSEKPPKKKKKKDTTPPPPTYTLYTKPVLAADGKTWLPAPSDPAAKFLTGTSYMWAGIVGGGKKPKKSVGLPRVGPPRRDGGRGGT